jgi:high-affinity Fe2+/Pb2+ permease
MSKVRTFWRGSDQSEKVPLIVLGVCVAILIGVLIFRLF